MGRGRKRFRCLLGIHKTAVNKEKSTPMVEYCECVICGERWVRRSIGGFQPIDESWERKGGAEPPVERERCRALLPSADGKERKRCPHFAYRGSGYCVHHGGNISREAAGELAEMPEVKFGRKKPGLDKDL